jgi:hypothetical protein
MTDVTWKYRVDIYSWNVTTGFPGHEVRKFALHCGLNLEWNLLVDSKKCIVRQQNLHQEYGIPVFLMV